MSKEAQEHYLILKENNELEEVFPNATGNWETDKTSFVKLYRENIKFVLDFEKNGTMGIDPYDIEEDGFDDSTF